MVLHFQSWTGRPIRLAFYRTRSLPIVHRGFRGGGRLPIRWRIINVWTLDSSDTYKQHAASRRPDRTLEATFGKPFLDHSIPISESTLEPSITATRGGILTGAQARCHGARYQGHVKCRTCDTRRYPAGPNIGSARANS